MLWVRFTILISILILASPVFAQNFNVPVPDGELATPQAQLETDLQQIPHSAVHNYLSTAVAEVNSLPDSIFIDEQGNEIIENETATQLFGYMKWMFSGNSPRELLGETLSPIGLNLYILLGIIIALVIVWAVIRVAILIIRFVTFLIDKIIQIIAMVK